MATKQCSKCDAAFTCTAPIAGCWCEQYQLTGETLATLRAQYADCLCPQCLSDIALGQGQGEQKA
ncbi:MAG TPA: cysteine-rich CWC family protein [Flavipsychrobacter sp.]